MGTSPSSTDPPVPELLETSGCGRCYEAMRRRNSSFLVRGDVWSGESELQPNERAQLPSPSRLPVLLFYPPPPTPAHDALSISPLGINPRIHTLLVFPGPSSQASSSSSMSSPPSSPERVQSTGSSSRPLPPPRAASSSSRPSPSKKQKYADNGGGAFKIKLKLSSDSGPSSPAAGVGSGGKGGAGSTRKSAGGSNRDIGGKGKGRAVEFEGLGESQLQFFSFRRSPCATRRFLFPVSLPLPFHLASAHPDLYLYLISFLFMFHSTFEH